MKNVGPIRHCEPFYIAIHQVSLLSHATTVARRLRIDVHMIKTMRDWGDRYVPIEWAQLKQLQTSTIFKEAQPSNSDTILFLHIIQPH